MPRRPVSAPRPAPVLVIAAPHAGSALLCEALGLELAPAAFANLPADARLIYLYRDPRDSIASMLAASPDPSAKSVIDTAVAQWESCTRAILEELTARPDDSWIATTYQALTTTPDSELRRLAAFVGSPSVRGFALAPPPDKLRAHALALIPRMSAIASTNTHAKLVCAASMEAPMRW